MIKIREEQKGDIEAFMIMILDKDSMKNVKGIAGYRDEFNEAM